MVEAGDIKLNPFSLNEFTKTPDPYQCQALELLPDLTPIKNEIISNNASQSKSEFEINKTNELSNQSSKSTELKSSTNPVLSKSNSLNNVEASTESKLSIYIPTDMQASTSAPSCVISSSSSSSSNICSSQFKYSYWAIGQCITKRWYSTIIGKSCTRYFINIFEWWRNCKRWE